MTDLEPCPFCGGTPDLDDYRDKPAAAWVLVHRSRACPIAPMIQSFPTGEAASKAWNTRAPSSAARERDAMREAVTAFFAVNAEFERRARNGVADAIEPLAGVQRKSGAELRVEGENAMQAMRQALKQEQPA